MKNLNDDKQDFEDSWSSTEQYDCWNDALLKQIKYEQERNQAPNKVCRMCGDKGWHLEKQPSRLGYDCLVIVDCMCASRIDWTKFDKKDSDKDIRGR